MKKLNLSNKNISSLKDIELCNDINKLNLFNNDISDLKGVIFPKNLKCLF